MAAELTIKGWRVGYDERPLLLAWLAFPRGTTGEA